MDGNDSGLAGTAESMDNTYPAIQADLLRPTVLTVLRVDGRDRRGSPDVLVSAAAAITSSYMVTRSILVTVIVAVCVLATALVQN